MDNTYIEARDGITPLASEGFNKEVINRLESRIAKLEGKATLADDLADSVKPTGIDLINASMKRP